MKKYILALGLVSMLIGCNDDFMERYPLDNVTDENFWKTESDLKLYLNKLYPAYIKGHGDGWSQDKYITPLPVTGSPLAYGCLLYKSPSPRDSTSSRNPSSA